MQKHRISTNIGKDQFIKVELKQEFDLLQILSLKFTQKEAYTSYCSDYGVVCGRISVNNGLGVPNARVSIFIPISDEDIDDPVISSLYPYKSVTDRNENNYRYNLLPSRKQHGGHEPTGSFPDQSEILTREEVLEVYEKYYKYTVKTNDSGDFMIWGVPLGSQTLHVDVDLSDIGSFSLRPYDFIRLGIGEDRFKNSYSFASSEDIDSLPQIVSFDKTIEVFPLWGNESVCEIGITRTDFDLSSIGVKIEPKAYLIGGTYTDSGKNAISKNCTPKAKMGRKCDLQTKTGKIESIRFSHLKDSTNRPILEQYNMDGDIPEDGGFFIPIPMNTEFIYTNEFGEIEITNDPNKGVATAACYRFKFSLNDSGNERSRKTASYLVPNIREYQTNDIEKEKSYAFSTNLDDYPVLSVSNDPDNGILYNVGNQYYPRDYFFRMTYNKVYTVSSFQNIYYNGKNFKNDKFIGIKEIVPSEEEDCSSSAVTPPVNFAVKNSTFSLLITEILLFIEQLNNLVVLTFFNVLADIFHKFADVLRGIWVINRLGDIVKEYAYSFQESTQRQLYLINYPECEECSSEDYGQQGVQGGEIVFCEVGTIEIIGSDNLDDRLLIADKLTTLELIDKCSSASQIDSITDFIDRQSMYYMIHNSNIINLDDYPFTYDSESNTYIYNDINSYFTTQGEINSVKIVSKEPSFPPDEPEYIGEDGCEIYDKPYDKSIVEVYYVNPNRTEIQPQNYVDGMDLEGAKLSDRNKYQLITNYKNTNYTPITKSGFCEFQNGIFSIIPGTLSVGRLYNILKEYRRRKRVGVLFCGGIVNYSFIDNWLSGSLYFFQFKGKKLKFCPDVIRYSTDQDEYYYRSGFYFNEATWGTNRWKGDNHNNKLIGRPTTMVDLGPRDEFIKEICVDPNLDPNCSVARSIGPTSYQNFGEIMGMAINYRMDVSNSTFSINNFFDNNGFGFTNRIFDGDILQLISINNETGIEEFDLQSPRYLGYQYDKLDPELNKTIFQNGTGVYGPLPITFYLDENGESTRLCINQPKHIDYHGNIVQGRLTESSQKVPFFLWDKKGTGFGPYQDNKNMTALDDQSWDYTSVQVQPLQGMTYGYLLNGPNDDSKDKYLLLPITYTNNGKLGLNSNVTDNVDFDAVIDGSSSLTGYTIYDSAYPGFTVLSVTKGTVDNPEEGILYTRYGSGGTWNSQPWNKLIDFFIRKTKDYYNDNKQILSTPFMFYFGLRPGNTGVDKLIKYFGPKGAFPPAE